MLKISGKQMRRANRSAVASLIVVGLATVAAACGTTDEASRETLPPLETTTTTTTTTTTIPIERFYTVQRGDILAVIASDRGVTVAAIVELNDLSSPDAIQAGQVLEIPQNIIINVVEPGGP
ncbi:MAG: LysM repeat protein [Candidatus Aldehydirespiratoraceae bacterium]|jgi:LysM repeat protein